MKKFISLLIASAMVVSLIPATAFAGQSVSATAKVVGAKTAVEGSTDTTDGTDYGKIPELQLTIADSYYTTEEAGKMEIEVSLDDAEFSEFLRTVCTPNNDIYGTTANGKTYKMVYIEEGSDYLQAGGAVISDVTFPDKDEALVTVTGQFMPGDKVIFALHTTSDLNDGDYATVSVDSDMVEADDIVFVTCAEKGIEASIKELKSIAIDEVDQLDKTLKIKETVAGTFSTVGATMEMELSKGFEFSSDANGVVSAAATAGVNISQAGMDDNELLIQGFGGLDEIEIDDLEIIAGENVDAGDIATIEIKLYDGNGKKITSCEVEVVEVCDYIVTMSVDEDEDVPVFYSGVNVNNYGLTDNADHEALEVTIVESFPGAWSGRAAFELTLPEGVYATDVDVTKAKNFANDGVTPGSMDADDWRDAFAAAYEEGKFASFEFEKRTFDDVNTTLNDECAELQFVMTLVADYDFEGEITLSLTGDSVEDNEVVIAEAISAYTIEASQNDVIIDYRETAIDTPIIITEAEAGLWAEDEMSFDFYMEYYIDFDDDGTIEVNEDSEMALDAGSMSFVVDEESDDEAAVVTISDIKLYMRRDLAAGAYPLDVVTSAYTAFLAQDMLIMSEDADGIAVATKYEYVGDVVDDTDFDVVDIFDDKNDDGVMDPGEYLYTNYSTISHEVCENFVNIVTAGRDQADTFTTTVIVPVGENVIYSSGTQIELDVPAYISAAGYTMLPVRAVATAIGVATSNVLWDSATQQVTIIYGSKTIAMVIGQSYMTVNGTAIPTSASPEIVDGRTFLPLRDLATALSVTDISWDADTRTAQLN